MKKRNKHAARRPKKVQNPTAGTNDLGLLVGAQAIADYLDQPVRRVRHWAATGAIPLRKQGSLLTTTKAALRAHFGGGEAEC
jgi:hypothetical protein